MTVKLRVVSSPDAELQGKSYDFDGYATFLFGRSLDAHCRSLKDPYVSRNHFLLEVDPPKVLLKDFGSSNGTKVVRSGSESRDPQSVAPGAWMELSNGDRIIAGKTEFEIAVAHPIAPLPPPSAEVPGLGPVRQRCEVLGKLFEGGMASVFKLRDPETGQYQAMKVMRQGLADSNPVVHRLFLREIAIWKGLDHPNIIRFIEDGHHEGSLYLIMEFAPGGSVADRLAPRGTRLALNEVIPIMLQSLAGLAHLHKSGLVHRDMKPGNILLTLREGKRWAKIGDFGLARNFEQAGRIQSHISEPGLAMGSAGYMPKEQLINFKFVKPPGDVFAAGAAFYHMLTGQEVYRCTPGMDPFGAILDGDIVPIRELSSDFPEELAEVIDRSLQTEPVDRYPDATVMLGAVSKAVSQIVQ